MSKPRTACLTVILLTAMFSDSLSADDKAGSFNMGTDKHLFIDELLIAEKSGVELTVNPPQRKELVLVADRPWERGGITSYCNVFWDPDHRQYRLYYVPVDLESDPIFRIALATSADGIHWEKPNLGAVEWKGSKNNNIVLDNEREGTVMIDPNAPPERRYAIISSNPAPNLRTRLFTSPDGIHWTMHPQLISGIHSDSQISSFWDDQLRKYVHFPRVAGGGPGRAVGRVEMDRIDEPWPENITRVLGADDRDPPGMDLYTNAAEKYQLASNVYVAFPTPYYSWSWPGREYLNLPTLARGGKTNDGTLETQLATSRDGKTWTRWRTPYVPLCRHEELDVKVCMAFPGILYHDTHLDQYFGGYAFTHGDTQARRRLGGRQLGGIFRLEQRIDGFISANFNYEGGVLVTKPLLFQGNCLLLNLNTSASGEARVAILNADGAAIEGFTLDECHVINGDYLARPVAWHGNFDVSALSGTPVRLRFEMRGTKLYSVQFAERNIKNLHAELLGGWERSIDDLRNIASKAVTTASSAHPGDFTPQKAVDGAIGSHRVVDSAQLEWASNGEKAGAWL